MTDINFTCPICMSDACTVAHQQRILHPLWWIKNTSETIELSYVVCDTCGFVTQHPMVPKEIIFEYYKNSPTPSQYSFTQRSHLYKERADFILDPNMSIPKNRVIEIGAAYGDLLVLLDSFKERYAIEPSVSYGSELLKIHPNIHLVNCLLEELADTDGSLYRSADLVIAAHVLEHTSSPRHFLKELGSLVKDNGFLMLEVPSVEEFSTCKNPIFQNFFFGHIHHFSKETLLTLGCTLGFTPVKITTTAAHNYPVIRALFQKTGVASRNATYFRALVEKNSEEYCQAIERLFDIIDSNEQQVVLWGCGDDLVRLVNQLSLEQKKRFADKIILTDRNAGKQGKQLVGIEIIAPEKIQPSQFSQIVVSVKGEILLAHILEDITSKYKDKDVTQLF